MFKLASGNQSLNSGNQFFKNSSNFKSLKKTQLVNATPDSNVVTSQVSDNSPFKYETYTYNLTRVTAGTVITIGTLPSDCEQVVFSKYTGKDIVAKGESLFSIGVTDVRGKSATNIVETESLVNVNSGVTNHLFNNPIDTSTDKSINVHITVADVASGDLSVELLLFCP